MGDSSDTNTTNLPKVPDPITVWEEGKKGKDGWINGVRDVATVEPERIYRLEIITTVGSVRKRLTAIYDIKYLMKSCRSLRGGLNDLAEDLAVARYGPQHQAGSDSLLTAATFFKLRELFFEDSIDDDKYLGVLYGLNR